jgi:hypothetical protein
MAVRAFNNIILTSVHGCSVVALRAVDGVALVPQGRGIGISAVSTFHNINLLIN